MLDEKRREVHLMRPGTPVLSDSAPPFEGHQTLTVVSFCCGFVPSFPPVVLASADTPGAPTPADGHDNAPKTFTFDHVYGPNALQKNIYDETARPIVASVVDGYNGTVFAYGQTGTGMSQAVRLPLVGATAQCMIDGWMRLQARRTQWRAIRTMR